MTIDVRLLHFSKAPDPILVTDGGMVIDIKSWQFENAYAAKLVTVLGMTVFLQPTIRVLVAVSIMALQPSRLSYTGLPLSTVIEFGAEK